MRLGATSQDQFSRDFGAGGQRAHANIGAAQLFGDHAHGHLAHARAAVFLWNRQAKHTKIAQFLDQFDRDQLVLQVPLMRKGRDLGLGQRMELIADHFERLVQTRGLKRWPTLGLGQKRANPGLDRLCAAKGHQGRDGGGAQAIDLGLVHAHLGRADHLALIHRNAAEHLRGIFANQELGQQGLNLAKLAFGVQIIRPIGHLAKQFAIGGIPAKPVHGMLFAVQGLAIQLAICGNQRPYRQARLGNKAFRRDSRTAQMRAQIGQDYSGVVSNNGRGDVHGQPSKVRTFSIGHLLVRTIAAWQKVCGLVLGFNQPPPPSAFPAQSPPSRGGIQMMDHRPRETV